VEFRFKKFLDVSLAAIYIVVLLGLLYRSKLYGQVPVVAGEAYGLGDVIDLFISFIVVAIWCSVLLSGVIITLLNFKTNWPVILKSLLYATFALVGYFYIKNYHLIF